MTGMDARQLDARRLLSWYDRTARALPWRVPPAERRRGRRPDPYRVWLSEVMLQQTTVAAVAPYYEAFLARWPTVEAVAAAPLEAVLAAWAGLGYYARARNLHRAAIVVTEEHGGRFPADEAALRRLPGVGAYTAAAIAAIAFDRPVAVVDGNVERVLARFHDVASPLPGAKSRLGRLAQELVPARRPGDFAQALMDLGATVCTPRAPRCPLCPWRTTCRALADGTVAERPVRPRRPPRPLRHGVAFWAVRPDGAVLLRRRPEAGLLGGMMEVPCSPWGAEPVAAPQALAPIRARWRALPGRVHHVFTHFALELAVYAARVAEATRAEGVWVSPDAFGRAGLPSLMRKVARHALKHAA